jgi:hypothetical protein
MRVHFSELNDINDLCARRGVSGCLFTTPRQVTPTTSTLVQVFDPLRDLACDKKTQGGPAH